jgi:hypothetical protein
MSSVPVICLLAATLAQPAQAESAPARIERFLELCEASRRGAILQAEHALRGLRNQTPGTSTIRRQIAQLEEQLRVLRANARPVVPPLTFPPQVGAIGRLPRLSCHVDQIVSDDEMQVRCIFPVVVTSVRRFQPRGETFEQPVRLLIRGLPTRHIGEGSDIELLQVFEITGRETYRMRDGRSTRLLVLAEFDMRAVEPYFRRTQTKQ